MTKLNEITLPTERQLIVSFFDVSGFARLTQTLSPSNAFELVSKYYEFVGDIIEKDDGIVIKFMGDSGLVVYPDNKADSAVLHLKELKDSGDQWLHSQGADCRHIIKAHLGPVMCGPAGTKREKRFDVFGETVMIAAALKSNGFAITPQLYSKLNADTQKLLKKHTGSSAISGDLSS